MTFTSTKHRRSNSADSTGRKPLAKRLKACQSNEKMTDLELVGDDGVQVPAVRYILGCASPLLKKMLFGQSEKAKERTVAIEGFNSTVLQMLVDFCFTDEIESTPSSDKPSKDKTESTEMMTHVISLAELAHKYQVENLQQKVTDFVEKALNKDPSLACLAFGLAKAGVHEGIIEIATDTIRDKPEEALGKEKSDNFGGISLIGASKVVDLFLTVDQTKVEPLFLFEKLLEWRACQHQNSPGTVEAICKEAAKYINLEAICPSDLKETILPTGLVHVEKLMNIFMQQAIKATDWQNCQRVLVEGAGLSGYNGSYVKVETTHPGVDVAYERSTATNGFKNTYTLVKLRDYDFWFLEDSDHVRTYRCSALEGFPAKVPKTGWFTLSSSAEPCPECSYSKLLK